MFVYSLMVLLGDIWRWTYTTQTADRFIPVGCLRFFNLNMTDASENGIVYI